MRRTTPLVVTVITALALTATSCSATIPGLGGRFGDALALAPWQVVGSAETASGTVHTFVHDLATHETRDLGAPAGVSSVARDVHQQLAVGWVTTADGRELPTAWNPTTGWGGTIPMAPFTAGRAEAIGSTGFVTGWVVTSSGPTPTQRTTQAVLWDPDGVLYQLGYLPRFAATSTAADINGKVQVVGVSGRGSCCGAGGFVWDLTNRAIRELPGVLGSETNAAGINELGNIVGWAIDPATGRVRPATWEANTTTLAVRFLPDLGGGGGLTEVNDDGIAIGWSTPPAGGTTHGFCVSLRTGRTTDLGPVRLADIAPDGGIAGTDEKGQPAIWSGDTCPH